MRGRIFLWQTPNFGGSILLCMSQIAWVSLNVGGTFGMFFKQNQEEASHLESGVPNKHLHLIFLGPLFWGPNTNTGLHNYIITNIVLLWRDCSPHMRPVRNAAAHWRRRPHDRIASPHAAKRHKLGWSPEGWLAPPQPCPASALARLPASCARHPCEPASGTAPPHIVRLRRSCP